MVKRWFTDGVEPHSGDLVHGSNGHRFYRANLHRWRRDPAAGSKGSIWDPVRALRRASNTGWEDMARKMPGKFRDDLAILSYT